MSESVSPAPASATAAVPPNAPARESASVIDASCRWPLLLLFAAGALWLAFSTFLGIIASVKLHAPGFLADCAWLTIGRVRPAALNGLVYGFATQVSLGVLLWMMARLGGLRLLYPGVVVVAGVVWNITVKLGVLGILVSGPTGFHWLEMPRFTAPMLLLAFLLFAIAALINFAYRREPTLYVSQWYLVGALFWFAWAFSVGSYLLLFDPVRGVLQAAVNAWFTSNVLGLWLTPVGLAVIFYLIPKLVGRPLYNYWLAVFGFWTLAAFGSWNGLTELVGGPLPRWMTSASVVANVLLVVPVVAVALNWHYTLAGRYERYKTDIILRFVLVSAACYVLSAVVGILLGLPSVAALTQLTLAPVAGRQLTLYGFLGFALFAGLYYILPRLLQVDWPSTKLVKFHFMASVIGVAILFVALTVGGLIQGARLLNAETDFLSIIKGTIPFLGNGSLGLCVLLAGQVAFLWNLGWMVWHYCQRSCPVTEMLQAVETADAGGKV